MRTTAILSAINITDLGSVNEDLYSYHLYFNDQKTTRCYQQVFDYIKWEVPRFNPYSGGLDFESVFFKTACAASPDMELIGCIFYFKEAAQEKMGKLGINEQEIEITMQRGVFDLLTILPTNELKERGVPFVQEMIMNLIYEFYIQKGKMMSSEEKWDAFWKYFIYERCTDM